ncbi:MAG: C40 family peptidase [Atopobiaceae bacterium]|nr:C40 family peptidase [Atopobiaceae bacterium]
MDRILRRGARTVLIVIVALCALLAPALSRSAIATPQEDLAAASERLSSLGAELSSLEATLAEQGQQLEQCKYDIDDVQTRIDETKAKLETARAVLSAHMRYGYKKGPVFFIDVLLSATSFDDLVSRIYYMDKINQSEADAIQEIKTLEEELEKEMEELVAKNEELERQLAETQAQVDAYAVKVAEAQAYYNQLDAEVQAQLAREAAANAARNAEANNIANAIDAAQNGNANPTDITPNNGNNQPENGGNAGGNTEPQQSEPTPTHNTYGGAGVSSAYSCIGCPYVYAAAGPDSFDCSGLVCYCYGWARGRTTYAIADSLKADGRWVESMDQLNYGDLVFTTPGHVGIYIGNGMMIHAPTPGRTVCEAPVYAFYGGGTY